MCGQRMRFFCRDLKGAGETAENGNFFRTFKAAETAQKNRAAYCKFLKV